VAPYTTIGAARRSLGEDEAEGIRLPRVEQTGLYRYTTDLSVSRQRARIMTSSSSLRPRHRTATSSDADDLRERVLRCASDLFYREGVRAVGVDLIVEQAGVAKTTLYRYFPTKDALVAAFLQQEDAHFWSCWDAASARARGNPRREVREHLRWIAERLGRDNYRGCPQLNVSAEFSDPQHPARHVANTHKREMVRRLCGLAERLGARKPDTLGLQLSLLLNGAFVSSSIIPATDAFRLLCDAVDALLAAHVPREAGASPHHRSR
jgi:AcrR family transcriptional regulator